MKNNYTDLIYYFPIGTQTTQDHNYVNEMHYIWRSRFMEEVCLLQQGKNTDNYTNTSNIFVRTKNKIIIYKR